MYGCESTVFFTTLIFLVQFFCSVQCETQNKINNVERKHVHVNQYNLHQNDLEDGVHFYLFTRKNNKNYQELKINDTNTLKNSNFDPKLPTTFVIHGYMDNIEAEVIGIIKDNILEKEDHNVFGVDWSAFCMTILYNSAVNATKPVGTFVGSFIEFLASEGLDLKKTHLIGHSLGAHVSGFAGGYLKSDKVARITGLDPAKPGFENAGSEERLDKSDADFVDCIHTCAGDLGMGKPVCQVDFYPNGGENIQPGCPWYDFVGTCSHSRSYLYYAESIQFGHNFKSSKCTEPPINGAEIMCYSSTDLMGEPADPQSIGFYYVATNQQYPFANTTEL